MNRWIVIALAVLAANGTQADEILFPADPQAVMEIRKDCGAKGDGIADDTAAIQSAIEQSTSGDRSRFLYLPNGIYKITRTITFKPPGDGKEGSMVGPWIYGQDRDKTILRLVDGAEGFGDPAKPKEMIRGVSRPDGAKMNADFFDRTMVNLTIDTGNNAGAVGIKFYSNNTGLMKDVLIRGNGVCGLDLGFNDQNGPLLIQDIHIEGFATGINTGHILNSQTLSRVTVRDASQVGLLHRGQVLAVEGLDVAGCPLPIDTDGVLATVDCRLEGKGEQTGLAIKIQEADSVVYAARLTMGPGAGIANAATGKTQTGASVREFFSPEAVTLGDKTPKTGLMLQPAREPTVGWPKRAEDWVCANDFGAVDGDDKDDAEAIQKAVDEAAKRQASGVYLRGGRRGDPNWYLMKRDVTIHGSVQRVMGFGFVRIFGGSSRDATYPENLAKFIVADDPSGPQTVIFQHLQVFAPEPSFGIEARSAKRTVVCQTTGGTVIARPSSTVFMTNCVGHCYQEKGSTIWARQWNTERGPAIVKVNTRNRGGQLWILGMKTEATSVKVETTDGGRTEILGVHNYNTDGSKDDTPFFRVVDAAMSVAAYREINFGGAWWKQTVRAVMNGTDYIQPPKEWQTWSLLRAGK